MHIRLTASQMIFDGGRNVDCAGVAIVEVRHSPQRKTLRLSFQYGNVVGGAWVGVGPALPAVTMRDAPEEQGLAANPLYDPKADPTAVGYEPPLKVGVVREAVTTYADLAGATSEGDLLAWLIAQGVFAGVVA